VIRRGYVSFCNPKVVGKRILAGLSLGGVHGTNIRLHTYRLETSGKCPIVLVPCLDYSTAAADAYLAQVGCHLS
jgi:hypothetical protein